MVHLSSHVAEWEVAHSVLLPKFQASVSLTQAAGGPGELYRGGIRVSAGLIAGGR